MAPKNPPSQEGMIRRVMQNEVTWLLVIGGIVASLFGNFASIREAQALTNERLESLRTTVSTANLGIVNDLNSVRTDLKAMDTRLRDVEAENRVLKAKLNVPN